MNPSDPYDTNSRPPTPDWFTTIPSTPLPTQTASPGPGKKKVVLIAVIILALLCAITVGSVAAYKHFTACLTTEDYRQLSGGTQIEQAAFSPTAHFYSQSLLYENNSTTIAAVPNNPDQAVLVTKIADFYAKHSSTKPMIISLNGGYTPNDSAEDAAKRLSGLKAALIAQGVDESSIQLDDVYAIETEGELSDDSKELKYAHATISITSRATCNE